jgi:hypothetical protein
MRIATNNIGNYNPYINNRSNVTKQSVSVEQTSRLTPKFELNNIEASDQLSKEEKTFFAQLYPGQSEEVSDYQFYQSSGKMKSVSIGSIIDRKG